MNKKSLLLALFFCPLVAVMANVPLNGNLRARYNFNSGWLLHVGDNESFCQKQAPDASWEKVTLPHAFNEDEAFQVSIAEHTDTIVWYRKHFRLPASAKGCKVFLEFEGIRFGGEFWLNGQYLGLHENGVMAFGLDLTPYINYNGENILSARIDNSWRYHEKQTGSTFQWNDRNFNANYGGIPKNVWLHVTPTLYQTLPLFSNLQTTGTYVYAREIDITRKQARLYAESEVRNETGTPQEFSLAMTVEDMDGKEIASFTSSSVRLDAGATSVVRTGGLVNGLHFWSWGYGYLYNVYTSLIVNGKPIDVVKTRTGFRKTAFRDGMVTLNDRVLQMKGYAQRTSNEWPAVGMSVPAWLSDLSNRMVVEGNGNLVRWMHVTPWRQDVESCDRVGLIQAIPAGDAEKDVTGRRWDLRVMLMRDAIIYYRNNPSILFYECGNESISEEHMAEMKAVRDLYDPYGGRAIGSREMLDSEVAEYGGEMLYINKSADIPMWATEYCRDEALRKYWDDFSYPYHKNGDGNKTYHSTVTNTMVGKDASSYNRNQDTFFRELITRWNDYYRVRPGTGKRVSSGGAKIIFSDSNTHYRGTENYRRSGVTDAMRIPKDVYFAHQVMWDGWVDVEKHHSYICGHWNYAPAVEKFGHGFAKDVLVASTGEKVELFVNGTSKGFGERSEHFLFTFKNVVWEPGMVEAVSYDANGNEVSRCTKKTAGQPVALRMTRTEAPDGFKADGADLTLVEIEVVDKDGQRCPLAGNMVHFDLQGCAEWRGGIAQGKDGNYILDRDLPVECGVNRVLVRSTTKAGKVTLTASAEGLSSATLQFASRPVSNQNGLSAYVAADHLPSYLERGETPSTPSFQVTRQAIDIVSAVAGSNEQNVACCWDDNELSKWTNDGILANGWIRFELAHDALISEVELKMDGWRNRSYPISILIDDKEVFRGNTPQTLGYFSIPITPVKGRFVTIQLTGAASQQDAFGGIVEVAGHLEGVTKETANSRLGIVEIEIY